MARAIFDALTGGGVECTCFADGSLLLWDTTTSLSHSSQSRHVLVLLSPAQKIFSALTLNDGCLKYKEKTKTGPRPSQRLNYDVNIGPKPSPIGT